MTLTAFELICAINLIVVVELNKASIFAVSIWALPHVFLLDHVVLESEITEKLDTLYSVFILLFNRVSFPELLNHINQIQKATLVTRLLFCHGTANSFNSSRKIFTVSSNSPLTKLHIDLVSLVNILVVALKHWLALWAPPLNLVVLHLFITKRSHPLCEAFTADLNLTRARIKSLLVLIEAYTAFLFVQN
jgi:hypothetical protein